MHDLLIEDARIVDGTGAPAVRGSLCVRDGRIAAIHREPHPGEAAAERIDAGGLVLAPGFPLALAARADAEVRRWFLSTADDGEARAREAVAAALDGADFLAETHLAAARLDVNGGHFGRAARHLDRFLPAGGDQ